LQLDKEEGIDEVSWLSYNLNATRFTRFPSSGGTRKLVTLDIKQGEILALT
jgi:hypothetical protein